MLQWFWSSVDLAGNHATVPLPCRVLSRTVRSVGLVVRPSPLDVRFGPCGPVARQCPTGVRFGLLGVFRHEKSRPWAAVRYDEIRWKLFDSPIETCSSRLFFIVWSDPSCLSIRTSAIPYLFMCLRIHASAWLSVTDLFSLTSKTANRTPLLLATDFMCDLNVFSDFDVYTVLISMPVDRSARLTVVSPVRSCSLDAPRLPRTQSCSPEPPASLWFSSLRGLPSISLPCRTSPHRP